MTTAEMLVPMRHTTRITKADAREHWREQATFALVAMMSLFAAQAVLVTPAWWLDLYALEVFIQALGFSVLWAACRMAYTIYKYAKV
jgi:hypothetical protein